MDQCLTILFSLYYISVFSSFTIIFFPECITDVLTFQNHTRMELSRKSSKHHQINYESIAEALSRVPPSWEIEIIHHTLSALADDSVLPGTTVESL